MTTFQWEQSHIDWFVLKFKDREKDIDARTVQRNYTQKRGERLSSQDFRDLMRLVVQNKSARVTMYCVSSKKYRIRMVSENYPYIQELFDKEFFLNESKWAFCSIALFEGDYLGSIERTTETYQQEILTKGNMLRDLYLCAFLAYNFSGGDFDDVFMKSGFKLNSITTKEDICLRINRWILEFKALQLASDDMTGAFKGKGVDDGGRGYIYLFAFSIAISINSQMREWIYTEINDINLSGEARTSKRKKQKELLKNSFLPTTLENNNVHVDNGASGSLEHLTVPHQMLLLISTKTEVLNAALSAEAAWFDAPHFLESLQIIPVQQENKPST
jgi:hypothetical protein